MIRAWGSELELAWDRAFRQMRRPSSASSGSSGSRSSAALQHMATASSGFFTVSMKTKASSTSPSSSSSSKRLPGGTMSRASPSSPKMAPYLVCMSASAKEASAMGTMP